MSKHEIVIALFTIMYGLMLADIFASLHRLLRSREPVKWHWLPVAAAWFLLLILLKNFWDLAFISYGSDWMNLYYFLAYGHMLILIYLAASAVLPDAVPEAIDLREYYFENHRYFWGLMAAIILVALAISATRHAQLVGGFHVADLAGGGVIVAIAILLALNRRVWVHAASVSVLLLLVILEIIGKGMATGAA